MKKILLTCFLSVSSIFYAFAQMGGTNPVVITTPTGNSNALMSLISLAQTVVGRLVPFTIGLALLAFFWFLIQFIWKGGQDPDKHASSMKGMGLSILALFVMVSIWGIITFIGSIIGINQGGSMPGFRVPGK